VKQVLAKEGFKGFYKGALSNIFRGVGSSLVLVLYDELHEYFMPEVLHAP
jgi:solute carrier family 25 (adenine nucleotide translocator) protein 4/5/6/31